LIRFRSCIVGLIYLAAGSLAWVAEPPQGHAPAAWLTMSQLRELCLEHAVDTTYLNAFLLNLDDADLTQVPATDLFDDLSAALEAWQTFSWARELSQADFCRYVIPVRVDDEPLQRYRRWLMQELAAVVAGCRTAEEAALEVNLWQGERVTFQPTDWRDQAPLTTLSCGFGRCGEETILLVAALRTVGVAARMVYVPYWAHTNNNHAWVEVKVGQKWKYLGACEPEAALNRAWFDEPVLRAPILLSRVNHVDPSEPHAVRGRRSWQLNTTENYMTPCRLTVTFPSGWSGDDKLYFAVFNYGGIRPIVRLDSMEVTPTLDVGVGDFMLLGLFKGQLFLHKVTTKSGEQVTVAVDPTVGLPDELALCYPKPTKEQSREASESWRHRLKMARCQLESMQKDKQQVPEWIVDMVAPSDSGLARRFAHVRKAPGNAEHLWQSYRDKSPRERELFLDVLGCLSEKDLREIDAETMADYYEGAVHALSRFDSREDSVRKYVVSPRIGWEPTRPWRLPLESATGSVPTGTLIERARTVNEIVAARIGPMEGFRPVDPYTAWQAGSVSERLAPALACGMLRIAGVPAFVTPGKRWVTFYDGETWLPLYPAESERLGIAQEDEKGAAWFDKPATVRLTFPSGVGKVDYEEVFDLVRLVDGWPDDRAEAILDYSVGDSDAVVHVVPGDYLLTWGLRNRRGDVRIGLQQVHLEAAEVSEEYLALSRPPEIEAASVDMGIISTEIRLMEGNERMTLGQYMAGSPLLVFVTAAHHEPSVRMKEMVDAIAEEGFRVLILSGPGEITGYPEASQALLRSLKIPRSESDFRAGAPYYYYLLPDGKIRLSGNGYQLNFKSDFFAIAKALEPKE
jgi:hypothetical protein